MKVRAMLAMSSSNGRPPRARREKYGEMSARRRQASRLRRSRLVVWLAAIAGCVCAAVAQGEGEGRASRLSFDIPEQPLASALRVYGQTAGVEVLYESRAAAGLRSRPVHGDFTPSAALERLLSGTALKIRYTRPNAVTLASPSADDPPPGLPLASADLSLDPLRVVGPPEDVESNQFRDYADAVRGEIEAALRRNAKTRSGDYRIGVDVWIDESRRIRRTQLFLSTGDQDRDAAVNVSLQGVVVNRPTPANIPLPVHVMVVVRSLR